MRRRSEQFRAGSRGTIGHSLAFPNFGSSPLVNRCRFWRRHFGWAEIECVAGGRALRGQPRPDLSPWVFRPPIVLSRIFVRVGNGLNGPTFTIPDSMPGSLDCAARELHSPGYSVDTVTHATMPQAVDGLRNSSTTVMRRMLASIKNMQQVSVDDFF